MNHTIRIYMDVIGTVLHRNFNPSAIDFFVGDHIEVCDKEYKILEVHESKEWGYIIYVLGVK